MLHSYEKYVGDLQGEYLETFKKIEMYFKSNDIFIFYDDVDETISEILDMLLMAQEERKPIDKVVGNDMKDFCRRYVNEAYPGHNKRVFLSLPLYVIVAIFISCMLTSVYKYFMHEINNIWTGTYDISGSISALAIGITAGFVFDMLTKNVVFKLGTKKTKKTRMLEFLIVGIFACAEILIEKRYGIKFDVSLRNMTFLLIYILMVIEAGYIAYRITSKTANEEAYIRKAVKYINNQYNIVNKKRKNRGKAEISRREFINKKIKYKRIAKYIAPIVVMMIISEPGYLIYDRGFHSLFSAISVILIAMMVVAILFIIDYIIKFKVTKEIIESLR